MQTSRLPLILSVPYPRTLALIFTDRSRQVLHEKYEVLECQPEDVAALGRDILSRVRYVLGQPSLSAQTLEQMQQLRCILNVEGNLINNMPYDALFQRGIHVLITSQVFARPVAELGLAMALNLARGIVGADADFKQGRELWGGEGNTTARLLSGAEVGFIGFGDLGRALHRVLDGFDVNAKAFDPWLPAAVLRESGVQPATLDEVLSGSDFIFVVASVTSENQGFLGAEQFDTMRKGARLILLSRAEVVDFDALIAAAARGHILVASDVFPQEPMPQEHPVRRLDGFICSAHRAGALDSAFKNMGDMVLGDMEMMDRGLPPVLCKRAERETVSRLRSRPVSKN